MTVVVTGPCGHVGANLVRALLARGQTVRALVHHDRRALAGLDVELVGGDIQDPESLRQAFAGADTVYHTAARISISMRDWQRLQAINVTGTRHVAEACLQSGVRRLVHFGSLEALHPAPRDLPVDESRPLVGSPRFPPYARSKAASEMHVRQAQTQGLETVVLYPAAILGPHDYHLGLPNAGLLLLCSGRLWALVDGGFNWVDVRDVVEGAIRAAERAPAGSRYVLSGHPASLLELARIGATTCGARVPRLVLPIWLAALGAPLVAGWSRLTGARPLFTTAALKPLGSNRHASHERATRDLDYRPRPLEETIADTLAWFSAGDGLPQARRRTG